jgi:YbbR domain-containing protein
MSITRIKRPRYRKHRRQSRRLAEFLTAMSTKYTGQETAIVCDTVGSDLLALPSTPTTFGPYSLRGAAPPELRDLDRIWITVDGSDDATVYTSLEDLSLGRGAVDIATWDLSPDIVSLSADDAQLTTLNSVDTVATLTTADTFDSLTAGPDIDTLGTPVVVSAVTNGADTLTIVTHGYSIDDGPFYVASTGDIPTGLAATTPYWIKTVPTADTFTLAGSLGGALIDITSDGTGDITFIPVNVDVSLETLYAPAHGLATGRLVRVATDGALPTGLTADTDYWAIAVDADHLAFAADLADSVTETAIDLTAIGSGTTTVNLCNVDASLDVVTMAAHGYQTGDGPIRIATGTTLPVGLVAATDYWVRVTDADRFGFALSLSDANDDILVDLTGIGAGTQTVSNVNVDTTTNALYSAAHGLTTGTLVRLTTDGALPTGVSTGTNYWVIAVDADHYQFAANLADSGTATAVNLTAVGSGTTTVSRCDIDTTLDTYTFTSAHGWVTGDGPVRATTGTTLPTGVTADTDYYIVRVSDTVVKLSDTEAHALAGTNIVDITAIGAGTQTLTRSDVDLTENGLRVDDHGMQTGDGPVRFSTGGTLPAGLLAATDYYVIRVDANHFKVSDTAAHALAGTDIVNITDIGTGTHQLVRALSIGIDMTADGIFEFLRQGVHPDAMFLGAAADADTLFV